MYNLFVWQSSAPHDRVLEIEIVESIFLGGSSSNHFYVNDITEYASEVRCLYGNLVRPTIPLKYEYISAI